MTLKHRLAAGAGLALIMLTQGFSCSTASISGAQMARTTKDSVAVDPTSTFKTSDHELHCAAVLANAPDDTKVRARWIAVKAGDVPPNTQVIENVIESKGANNLDFKMTVEKDLPPGDYKVELALNPEEGKEQPPAKVVEFKVEE
jgi:hypothetical protein